MKNDDVLMIFFEKFRCGRREMCVMDHCGMQSAFVEVIRVALERRQ